MNKHKILIIDDEVINISLVVNLLSEHYDVFVTTDPKEGLHIAYKEMPSLILLDIIMPDFDGFAVARELKKDSKTKNIPFIFLTAKSDAKSIVAGFEQGAVDYISKPFVKEELLARVKLHLKLQDNIKDLEYKNIEIVKKREEFELIFSQSYDGIALTDLETNFLLVNDSYCRITGYSKDELYSTSCRKLSVDKSDISFIKSLKDGHIQNIERKCKVKDRIVYVNMSISLMPNEKMLLLNTKDVTDLKLAQKKLQNYAKIMDEHVISSTTDLDGRIIRVSKAFEKVSGYKEFEILGRNHNILRDKDTPNELYSNLWSTIVNNRSWSGEIRNISKSGDSYWSKSTIIPEFDDNGDKIGYTAIRQNITLQKKIEEISIRDELTNIFNRRYFNDVFESEINRVKRCNNNFLFIMLDVDYFKNYNDFYGHQDGDIVLIKIGEILNQYTKRSGDYAFRLGGEEFGIIAQNKSLQNALGFAEQLRTSIEELKIRHKYNRVSSYVTVSIGLIFKNLSKDDNIKNIYKECDDLLYKAKESGRNRVEWSS